MQATTELDAIREALKEARRYVRKDIEHTRGAIDQVLLDLGEVHANTDGEALERLVRLADNLELGLEYIQVNPGVLEGYIDGAVFELGLKGVEA